MQEIATGLWHWTARHDHIGVDVSSYFLPAERVLLDPMLPDEGIDWLAEHGPPEHILLTNRHHDRHSWELRERFDCTIHCIRNGMHELEGRGPAEPFDFGDELPGGIVAYEVDAISADETALHIPAHDALACADGVIHYESELGFVPERYMDDPAQTKANLREAYARLLDRDLDFDILLTAHGSPWVGGAKEALRRFASAEA